MRALYFILCLIAALVAPWFVALVLGALYALRYTAYELLLIGIALDVAYGVPMVWFPAPVLYTLGSALLLLLAELIKPHLAFYETNA